MSGRLGTLIRLRREELRLSMRECAAKVGVSAPFWCDVEHGRRFPAGLVVYADALGIPVADLEAARAADRPVPTDLESTIRRIVREELASTRLPRGPVDATAVMRYGVPPLLHRRKLGVDVDLEEFLGELRGDKGGDE